MQGKPATAADELRWLAERLAQLVGATKGYWTIDVRIENGVFKNLRRHHGPIYSDDELEAIARVVGLLD
jgi:hypothetical protein